MKGICFIEPLFHAVVKGSKTQTRRIMPKQPRQSFYGFIEFSRKGIWRRMYDFVCGTSVVPRYQVDEVLYLKEPYYLANYQGGFMGLEPKKAVKYKYGTRNENFEWQWKNKLFMPEKYARYFIKITAVRCERLQDISVYDCEREGVFSHYERGESFVSWKNRVDASVYDCRRKAFANIIDKVQKGTWESNPYVWVYDFELVK